MMSEQARQSRDDGQSISLGVPLFLLALAFFAFTAIQTYELVSARSLLATARANQEEPLKEIAGIRGSIKTFVNETLELAKSGNAPAKEVVDALAKQGILKFGAPPAQPPAAQH